MLWFLNSLSFKLAECLWVLSCMNCNFKFIYICQWIIGIIHSQYKVCITWLWCFFQGRNFFVIILAKQLQNISLLRQIQREIIYIRFHFSLAFLRTYIQPGLVLLTHILLLYTIIIFYLFIPFQYSISYFYSQRQLIQ